MQITCNSCLNCRCVSSLILSCWFRWLYQRKMLYYSCSLMSSSVCVIFHYIVHIFFASPLKQKQTSLSSLVEVCSVWLQFWYKSYIFFPLTELAQWILTARNVFRCHCIYFFRLVASLIIRHLVYCEHELMSRFKLISRCLKTLKGSQNDSVLKGDIGNKVISINRKLSLSIEQCRHRLSVVIANQPG